MKKNILVIILTLFLFAPIKVMANEVSIIDPRLSSKNNISPGEELSVSFFLSFSGIQKGDLDSLGVAAVDYELIYDDKVFVVTDITSREWDSILYKDNEQYRILSMIGDEDPAHNKCIDGVLFCADYGVTIKFYTKDTDKETTEIKVGDITVGLLKMIDPNKEYTEEDVVVITGTSDAKLTVSIEKKETTNKEEPPSIIENTKPNVSDKIDNITNKDEIDNVTDKDEIDFSYKSYNNYLKLLKIENYKINFHKYVKDYNITIEPNVNKLNLTVELDDSKANYKIIGADDLKKNNYKVLIEVTAENGNKKTYTINIKVKEETKDVVILDDNVEKNKKTFKLEKKYIIIGSIIVGIILLLITIIKFIVHIKDRKLEKALDEL